MFGFYFSASSLAENSVSALFPKTLSSKFFCYLYLYIHKLFFTELINTLFQINSIYLE